MLRGVRPERVCKMVGIPPARLVRAVRFLLVSRETSGVGINSKNTKSQRLVLRIYRRARHYSGISAAPGGTLRSGAVFQVTALHHIFAFESNIRHGVREGLQPHTIDAGKAHQDVQVAN